VVGGTTWMGMIAFVGATLYYRAVRPAAVLILPVSFAMMMVGGILPCHPLGPSPVFKGWQLWLHVIGGGFTYGFAFLAAAMSLFYMAKAKGKTGYPYDELPELGVLDKMKDQFFLAAVVLATLMIHFAILWVHMKLPAEFVSRAGNSISVLVWSYWMIFAVWLGLRYGLRWTGRKLVWYAPVALIVVMVCTFYFAPFTERSYHTGPFFPPYDQPQHMKPFLLNSNMESNGKPDTSVKQNAPVSSLDKVDHNKVDKAEKVAKLLIKTE